MNAKELKNKLNNVAKESASAAAAVPTTESAPTDQFSANNTKKPVDEETKKKLSEIKQQAANMLMDLKAAGSGKTSEHEKRLRDTVSKTAFVAGYVTKHDSKIDFAPKKDKATDTVDIVVKQYAPTKIELVMVMVPEGLLDLFDKQNDPTFDDRLAKYAGSTADTTAYQIKYIPWSEFINWLLTYTQGYIGESRDLFNPYISKSKTITALGDVESPAGIPNGAYLYVASRNAKDTSKMFIIKHTYRSKIVAPGNYISMERYKEINIPTTCTAEEAKNFIQMYLTKFTTSSDKKPAYVTKLSLNAQANVTVDATTNTITSTTFFPTSGASYFADPSHAIKHWCLKKAGPNETVVDETLPVAKLSAKYAVKTNKNGVETVKYKYDTEKLRDSDSVKSSYHCDAITFPAIYKATKNLLTINDLSLAAGAVKTAPARTGKGKVKAARSTLIGSELIGVDHNQLLNILQDAANKKKAISATK